MVHKNATELFNDTAATGIYTIADLSQVWVFMDAYESDVPWLRYGQEVEFTVETYPGEVFSGRIAFIDPILDEKTRTVRVRVNVPNQDLRLKPGMFVRARVRSRVAEGGQVIDNALAGKWVSPVYNAYLKAGSGLASDKMAVARAGLEELLSAVKQVDATVLDENGRSRWKTVADGIEVATMEALDGKTRELTRKRFLPLSTQLLAAVQTFGQALDGPLYQFHCAMALDNTGATWLQESDQIRNPYFGPEMGTCGETRATFMPAKPLDVPPAFLAQLAPLYGDYLKLQTALAADDGDAAGKSAAALESRMQQVDESSLDPRAKDAWESSRRRLTAALGKSPEQAKIDDLRSRFEGLSLTMLGVADNFGNPEAQPLYKMFCPMAFKNRGAAWLQQGKQVSNPYFGAKMLRCGAVKREFEPSPDTIPNSDTQETPAPAAEAKDGSP